MRRVLPWLLAIGLVGLPVRVAHADDPPWAHPYVLGRGVGHWEWRRSGPDEDIRVTTVARGAPVRMTPVLSNDEVAEDDVQRRLELTSSMCTRVAALACVNGDFGERRGNGAIGGPPAGGLIRDGEVLRSFQPGHHQLFIGPDGLAMDNVRLTQRLVAVPQPPLVGQVEPEQSLPIAGINVQPGADVTVLYTPAYADTTQTGGSRDEMALRLGAPLRPADGVLRTLDVAARTLELRLGRGDLPIPRDGVVVSARGRAAGRLRQFWDAVHSGNYEITLQLTASRPVSGSIGFLPPVLRNGRRAPQDDGNHLVRGRAPRTVVGWNRHGTVFLVTVDGRRPDSVGMTIGDTADLLLGLGATDAAGLDGGGSTTFVAAGPCPGHGPCVLNRPSDGRERPVSSALAVVPVSGR